MKTLQPLLFVTLMLAALSLTACSGDSNNASNNTTNNANNQADMGMMQDMPAPTNNAPGTWEEQYQIIFLDMNFKPGSPGSGVLNTVLRKSFNMATQEYPTIILVDLKEIDADAGTTRIKGGAGTTTAADGEFKWDAETPDVYYDGTIKKDDGEITGTFSDFKFIATIPTESDPLRVILPIQDLSFKGNLTVAEGGVKIDNGDMTGYLTKEQGDEITIFLNGMTLTLTSLLKESTLNLDTDGDNVNDAWKLEATFKAGPAKIVQ